MRRAPLSLVVTVVLLQAGVFAQQSNKAVVGTLTSPAAVMVDDARMEPTAAAAWPVVEGDEIAATSAPALFTTTDRNLVTLDRLAKAKVKTIGNGQTYVYVRQGGVSFDTQTSRLDICIANRLFNPGPGSRGVLRLEKTGLVSRALSSGNLIAQGEQSCDDEAPSPLASQQPPTAPGGAAGGTATAPTAAPTGVSTRTSVVVGAIGAASAAAGGAVGVFSSSCAAVGGCNHNPLSISPSTP